MRHNIVGYWKRLSIYATNPSPAFCSYRKCKVMEANSTPLSSYQELIIKVHFSIFLQNECIVLRTKIDVFIFEFVLQIAGKELGL